MRNADGTASRGSSFAFHPVVNGVDFLDSAIESLAVSEDPRKLKYAVLHLQAAVEILVKVRLQREGAEHIFEDPYSADEGKLRQGDFKSVTLSGAMKRLDKVAGIKLSGAQRDALNSLSRERNKLQHFGSTSNQQVVTGRAATVLDILSQFIDEHLLPDAPAEEVEHLERGERLITAALTDIAEVTKIRMARIAPELDSWQGIVINCPECRQLAWTFKPYDDASCCRFCAVDWGQFIGVEVAEDYALSILGESRHEAAMGRSGWSIVVCPECEREAFAPVVVRNSPPSQDVNACFSCGLVTDWPLGSCNRCGRHTLDVDDTICVHCLQDLSDRD